MPAAVRRIAMWSGPRNISTALLRAWGNRPDTFVCDEHSSTMHGSFTVTWASRARGLAYGRALAWHARPGSWLTVDITSFALSRGIFSLALSPVPRAQASRSRAATRERGPARPGRPPIARGSSSRPLHQGT